MQVKYFLVVGGIFKLNVPIMITMLILCMKRKCHESDGGLAILA